MLQNKTKLKKRINSYADTSVLFYIPLKSHSFLPGKKKKTPTIIIKQTFKCGVNNALAVVAIIIPSSVFDAPLNRQGDWRSISTP